MDNFTALLTLVGTLIGVIVTALSFLVGFIKNVKAKNAVQTTLDIGNIMLAYIRQAEQFVNYDGIEKKEWVMTKVNQFAINNGLKFDFEAISTKVEEIVALTKCVNTKKEKLNEEI